MNWSRNKKPHPLTFVHTEISIEIINLIGPDLSVMRQVKKIYLSRTFSDNKRTTRSYLRGDHSDLLLKLLEAGRTSLLGLLFGVTKIPSRGVVELLGRERLELLKRRLY